MGAEPGPGVGRGPRGWGGGPGPGVEQGPGGWGGGPGVGAGPGPGVGRGPGGWGGACTARTWVAEGSACSRRVWGAQAFVGVWRLAETRPFGLPILRGPFAARLPRAAPTRSARVPGAARGAGLRWGLCGGGGAGPAPELPPCARASGSCCEGRCL